MSSSWSKDNLGDLCNKIGSGVTPRGGSSVYVSKGCSLIRSQNVYNLRFDYKGLVYINSKTALKMKGVELLPNDILLNITGDSVARCCMVPNELIPARVNQHVSIIRPKEELLNPKFLLYFMNLNSTKEQLLSYAGAGATRKALTKTMIESIVIKFPELKRQKLKSNILSYLDDKI
jgi:type I restriction enzyme S subunit